MDEKKSLKINLSTVFLFFAVLVIIAMASYIYSEKTNYNKEIAELEANAVNMQDTIDELQGKFETISNTINSGKIPNNENTKNNFENDENNNNETSINDTLNKDKSAQYVFTSADLSAVQGYPKTLKIFELNDFEMEFDYNSGLDFSKRTIDRQVTGTARAITEQMYEFEEVIDGHKYKIIFEFDKTKETIKVRDFDNGNEFGWINLFR